MGNAQVHDPTPVLDDNRRELNLSRKLTHKQYTKHLQGDHSESCLVELPWQVRDSVSLYERMDVSFNALLEIPSELPLRLPHLSYINLNHNCIVTLPDSFGLLFHLNTLLLSHNKISTLPKSFCHLSKLNKLDLSHNCIRELPEEFGQLRTLSRLNVSENKLKYLPKTFGSSLEVILAHSNRLIDPPQCLANEGSEVLIEYMKKGRSLADQGGVHCQTASNVFARVWSNQQLATMYNPTSDQSLLVQQRMHAVNISNRVKTPLLPPPDSSSLEQMEVRDKILGLIYGAAIGDAIGMATKDLGPDECEFHYDFVRLNYSDIVRDKQRVRWRTGDWTTNFDQFILVLDCILNWAGVVDELDFAHRLLHWFTHGFPELGDHEGYEPNSTIVEVVASSSYVQDPHAVAESLLEDAERTRSVNSADDLHANSSGIMRRIFGFVDAKYADNGALARCLILGVTHYHSLTEVTENTIRICKATHADPRCLASAVVLTNVIARMMQGKHDSDKSETLTQLVKRSCDTAVAAFLSNNDKHAKEFMGSCNQPGFESIDAREELKVSYVLKTLSCALIGLQKSDDFRTTITDVIKMGGDSNTNACVTGAMVGCKLGFSKLPSHWLHGLRKRQMDWLNLKVNFLLDMMGSP